MKKLVGLLGGYGSRATALILDRCMNVHTVDTKSDADYPHVLVYNYPSQVSTARMDDHVDFLSELLDNLDFLYQTGCSRVVMGCNSLYTLLPEHVYDAPYIIDIPKEFTKAHLLDGRNRHILCSRMAKEKLYPGISSNQMDQDLIDVMIQSVIERPPTDGTRSALYFMCAGKEVVLACTELSVIYWSMPESMRRELNVLDTADFMAKQLSSTV